MANPGSALVLTAAGAVVTAFYTSICGVVKTGMFPAQVRGIGAGLGSSLGSAVFAGSAALVASSVTAAGRDAMFDAYVTLMI